MLLGILRTGALLLLAGNLFAQSPTASVFGSVRDSTGAAATGITVEIENGNAALTRKHVSDSRNDVFTARNFFAEAVQPLRQQQFGATPGGPVRHDHLFVFGYCERYPDRQGLVCTTTVPTVAQRGGNYSGVNAGGTSFQPGNLFSGTPAPGIRIPETLQSHNSRGIVDCYPEPNQGMKVAF